MRDRNVFEAVYEVVKRIPPGRVTTYGQISDKLKQQNSTIKNRITPRIVGFALHANKDPKVPCHRVVNKNGRTAESYAFGGAEEQKRRLSKEGVKFKDKMHVNLNKCLWKM